LLYQHGVEAHFVALEGVLWARISAHVYNEIGDYPRLATTQNHPGQMVQSGRKML
jgi:hypothetical protein